ncbi:transcriptional regulator [Gordonia sp. TBRC 11910]|uniref:Transcriptional regulator n=1 Tax=Gordonia asplenii TaxID=2725283 RepID=A0A848KRN3_9ACTN|nr:transcriptional regulator [Gordonia asplenii]NMO00749.1 transcriptional regulator [Gordonia asplenii]
MTLSDPRAAVLRTLRNADGPVDAATVAKQLQVHVTTARFHLNNLIKSGEASTAQLPSTSVGRPRLGYVAAPDAPTDELVALLLGQLGPTAHSREQRAAEAGRLWAARHPAPPAPTPLPDPVTVVVDALRGLGFQIRSTTSAFGSHELTICSCPLKELSTDHPEIAQGIARGVIEEALATASAALGSQYAVAVRPDVAGGNCEITVGLSPQVRSASRH